MRPEVYAGLMTVYLIGTIAAVYLAGSAVFPSRDKTDTSSAFSQNNLKARHIRYVILARSEKNSTDDDGDDDDCGSSSDEFPVFLTEDQVTHGGVVACFLIGIYCFTLLALICDNYFIPCVERICEVLHLSPDVTAATFMSVATSAPEFFTNIIGTFITKSDIGIGTIVGSSMFNTLGVAALGGLAAPWPVKVAWWPVTRDVIIYMCSVLILIGITWDGLIQWYEALVLFIVYFIYFTVMFQNDRISKWVLSHFEKKNKVDDCEKASPEATGDEKTISEKPTAAAAEAKNLESKEKEQEEEEEEEESLFRRPKGTLFKKIFFYYTWPLKLFLFFTIPDPKRHKRVFPLSFLICIVFIGVNSYIVSWMISLIGNLFHMPDAVLGMTFLAAGGCLPESISITLMMSRGKGQMGVSNSLGANSMNILLSLGMPWFLKTMIMGANKEAFIKIESGSIEYTIAGLILVAIVLYITLYLNNFTLRKRVGVILMSVYVIFITLAILIEMVFFDNECVAS